MFYSTDRDAWWKRLILIAIVHLIALTIAVVFIIIVMDFNDKHFGALDIFNKIGDWVVRSIFLLPIETALTQTGGYWVITTPLTAAITAVEIFGAYIFVRFSRPRGIVLLVLASWMMVFVVTMMPYSMCCDKNIPVLQIKNPYKPTNQ